MKINAFLDKNRFTNIKQKKERKKERESSLCCDSTNKGKENVLLTELKNTDISVRKKDNI
jgi:hypothetical protein